VESKHSADASLSSQQ
jgi:hypothetical protein